MLFLLHAQEIWKSTETDDLQTDRLEKPPVKNLLRRFNLTIQNFSFIISAFFGSAQAVKATNLTLAAGYHS